MMMMMMFYRRQPSRRAFVESIIATTTITTSITTRARDGVAGLVLNNNNNYNDNTKSSILSGILLINRRGIAGHSNNNRQQQQQQNQQQNNSQNQMETYVGGNRARVIPSHQLTLAQTTNPLLYRKLIRKLMPGVPLSKPGERQTVALEDFMKEFQVYLPNRFHIVLKNLRKFSSVLQQSVTSRMRALMQYSNIFLWQFLHMWEYMATKKQTDQPRQQ